MARIIRKDGPNLVSQVTHAHTHTFGTSTGQYTTLVGLTPPIVGARVAKWWIQKDTVGTGTQTLTCFLVAAGGTSSTRQISDSIAVDISATAPTYQEAGGLNAPYALAATDLGVDIDINFTADTTSTAMTGVSVGVVWQL